MLQSLWRQFLAKRDLHYRLETMRTIMDLEHEGDSDQAMRSEGHRVRKFCCQDLDWMAMLT